MKIKEAIKSRIIALCDENDITLNSLSYSSGMCPTSVYSIVNNKNKNPVIVSLKKICDGFGITIRDFFNTDLFDNVEQEVE